MNNILPTLYKFIYATHIKVSMLTREKILLSVSSASHKGYSFPSVKVADFGIHDNLKEQY